MAQKSQIRRKKAELQTQTSPVLPALVTKNKAELVVNEDAHVWLLYRDPLAEIVKWAEYDADTEQVTLIMVSGNAQPLGIKLPDEMKDLLLDAETLYLVQMEENKKIADMGVVPLIVRALSVH